MSDHAILGLIAVGGFTLQIAGLVFLGVYLGGMLRESQRLTRAVAGLVYQETDRLRQQLGDH